MTLHFEHRLFNHFLHFVLMYYKNRIFAILTSFLLLPIAFGQAQAIPVSVNCDERSFVVNFENVSTPITKTISVSGPIKKCELKEVRSAPGWNKGKGCKFTFSKPDSLSGVHRGVFGGKLNCGNGSGSGVTWTGSASFCPGGISNIRDEGDLDNCPKSNRIKSEGIGVPGSVIPIDGCSIPSSIAEGEFGWITRNVIAADPKYGPLVVGGRGPNSGLPCDVHDVCYRECGSDKGDCDNEIISSLQQSCLNWQGWDSSKNLQKCLQSTRSIETGISSIVGINAYETKQIKRCSCCN